MGDKIKASHIYLGGDTFSNATSSGTFFDKKTHDKDAAKATEATKKDLR